MRARLQLDFSRAALRRVDPVDIDQQFPIDVEFATVIGSKVEAVLAGLIDGDEGFKADPIVATFADCRRTLGSWYLGERRMDRRWEAGNWLNL